MSLYCALGDENTVLTDAELTTAFRGALHELGERRKVLAVPPDFTRFHSRAGLLTCAAYEVYGDALTDVLPALGTHVPMPAWQLDRMYPGLPHERVRSHDWRNDVVTIGHIPARDVRMYTEGIVDRDWPVQLNRLIWEGGHDLILSIGQVVPHEVVGMANYTKNLFVGAGGAEGINESHFIGAAYGMERMMGRVDTPVRRILNEAYHRFCRHLPVIFALTVVGPAADGSLVTRGLFIGDDDECFERAGELSLRVNFTLLDEEPEHVVVYLDPEEFHSTWLGNKSIYRTRMMIATDGELTVLGPEVGTFGEDPEIDRLIRRYGYRTTPEVMRFVAEHEDLRGNLSAAAHLIHGSSEGRFTISYAPGNLTREEIEGVGYEYAELAPLLERYDPDAMAEGWNTMPDGERVYFIHNPALGLWAYRGRFETV